MSTAPEGGAGVSKGWRVNLDGRGRCWRVSAGGQGHRSMQQQAPARGARPTPSFIFKGGTVPIAPVVVVGVSRGWRVNLDGRGRCCRGSAGGTGSQANAEARTREGR